MFVHIMWLFSVSLWVCEFKPSETNRGVLIYRKGARISKKIFHNGTKNPPSWEGLTVETRFSDMEKSNSRRLFSNGFQCEAVTRE